MTLADVGIIGLIVIIIIFITKCIQEWRKENGKSNNNSK